MALIDNAWYVSSVGYTAVPAWATGVVTAAGARVRQLATPSLNAERVFVCIVAGTTHASTEPTWVTTRGGKTTDNTVTWMEATGLAGLNGDLTNTPNWTTVKNTAVTQGQLIQRNSGGSLQICTTAGTAGNGAEPSFNNTAGATTADNTVVWTSLGAPSNFGVLSGPHARLQNAFATNWGQLGNIFYLADNHAEIQTSALTLTPPTGSAGCVVASFDHTIGSAPPTAATPGASISIGAANVAFTLAGDVYYEGVTFQQGTTGNNNFAFSNGQGQIVYLKNCAVKFGVGSGGGLCVVAGTSQCTTVWDNTTFTTTNAGHIIKCEGNFFWRNTPSALIQTTPPTSLLLITTGRGSLLFLEGVDLSAFTGVILDGTGAVTGQVILKNCAINASATINSAIGNPPYAGVDLVGTDSGTANYRTQRNRYEGVQSTETAIVRTGGATSGSTPVSWKLVNSANSFVYNPLVAVPIRIWNPTVGAPVTLTMYGIWGGGAVPNNNDLWIEVEYQNSSSKTTVGMETSGLATIISTPTAYPSDSSTWSGSTTKFKMAVTFTPQLAGYLTVYIKSATASQTFYVDPKPVLT